MNDYLIMENITICLDLLNEASYLLEELYQLEKDNSYNKHKTLVDKLFTDMLKKYNTYAEKRL